MRTILAVAALAVATCAASAASAATFAGSYSTSGNWSSNNNGLNIAINNGSGSFNVANLIAGGPAKSFNLFYISTPESVNVPSSGNDGDATPHSIHVNFTFSNPNLPGSGPDGAVNGTTVGVDGGIHGNDYGQLSWNAPVTVNFGSAGILTITLNPVQFDTYSQHQNENLFQTQNENHDSDENEQSGKVRVTGTFSLAAATVPGGVPEPASWALMIGGFGMAGGMLRRRRTAVAATA
jgi:hypothetical protein